MKRAKIYSLNRVRNGTHFLPPTLFHDLGDALAALEENLTAIAGKHVPLLKTPKVTEPSPPIFNVITVFISDESGAKWTLNVAASSIEVDEKIEVAIPGGRNLVVEKNDDPEFPYEVFVGITDSQDRLLQNLALIGQDYDCSTNDPRWLDRYRVCVWGDSENEDWTDEFIIDPVDISKGGNFQ